MSQKHAKYRKPTNPSLRLAPLFIGGFDTLPVNAARWGLSGGKLRLEVVTEGTEGRDGYKDVFIPSGTLYITLGSLGDPRANPNNVSLREGVVCVKQKGWHTGWYRTENRIAGVVRIAPKKQ